MGIILSTRNRGKAEQINRMFAGTAIQVISLDEAGIIGSGIEDGATLEENSYKKAQFAWHQKPNELWTMAEDTGLFIDALDGEPGLITAHWAGEEVKGAALTQYAIKRIKELPEAHRSAYWKTVATVIAPSGTVKTFTGIARGTLLAEPRGEMQPDLPYSAIFVPDEGNGKTWSEIAAVSIDDENAISHRDQAFRQVREYLLNQL